MEREFDRGYQRRRFRLLVADYPDESVYPADSFRVEWGPVFHRGRLDGTARVLVIGQDPATHETITRRILVGEAGQRAQGLLARLGITRSYVFINTFLYSVYGQGGGTRHIGDEAITRYRNRWIDAIVAEQPIEAIITLGQLADTAYQAWRTTRAGRGEHGGVRQRPASRPTPSRRAGAARSPRPRRSSGSASRGTRRSTRCTAWSPPMRRSRCVTTATPSPRTIWHRSPTSICRLGLPPWMGALDAWASRTGTDAQKKRATITVTVPTRARTWPPIS